jgi:hypothetical protein
MIRPLRVLALSISIAAALLLLAACGDDDDGGGDDPETLSLVSDPADESFEVVDLGPRGGSVGDVYVFDGAMLDPETDEVVGRTYGTQTSISLEGGTEIVQAMITYDLDEDGQILVGGTAEYEDASGLVEGEEYVRPVLGGTGSYAGVTGTMTTVRQADGSYEQTFDFGDD